MTEKRRFQASCLGGSQVPVFFGLDREANSGKLCHRTASNIPSAHTSPWSDASSTPPASTRDAMDGPSSLYPHPASHKRRSPPPDPRVPSPSPSNAPLYPIGTASALSFSSRSANSRSSFSTISSPPMLNGIGLPEEGSMNAGESSTAVHASPGVGGYAYSTTLRRQPSLEPAGFASVSSFHRSASPHHSSPYRKRTASETYSNGRPPAPTDEDAGGRGLLRKVTKLARKAMRRQDYEEVVQDEEERRVSAERRARETPSAIFAHQSIDVGQTV